MGDRHPFGGVWAWFRLFWASTALMIAPCLFPFSEAAGQIEIQSDNRMAMTVGHHEVTAAEFAWFMDQERPGVIRYFTTAYDLQLGTNFWRRDLQGNTPRALLKTNTVALVAKEKTEQALFLELGLVTNIRYSAFLKGLEQTNDEREQKVRRGDVVYGPVRYSAFQYYSHWKATLRMEAKEKLAESRFNLTDESLRAFWQKEQTRFKSAPYERVRAAVKRSCIEQQYETLVSNRMSRAEIKLNEPVLDSLLP
jgi:hypothetical protein